MPLHLIETSINQIWRVGTEATNIEKNLQSMGSDQLYHAGEIVLIMRLRTIYCHYEQGIGL